MGDLSSATTRGDLEEVDDRLSERSVVVCH